MFPSPITYTLHLPAHMKQTQATWFGESWFLNEADKPLVMSYHAGAIEAPTRLFLPGDGEFLGFFFNLGNSFECAFAGNDEATRRFKRHQYAAVYMPDAGCTYNLAKGQASVLWIHFPLYLFNLAVDYYPFLKALVTAAKEGRTYVVPLQAISIPNEIQRVIRSILYSNYSPETRDTFFCYSLSNLMFKCFEQIDMLHHEPEENADTYELAKINKIKDHIHTHLSDRLTLNALADKAGVAPRTLSRIFKKNCDKTVMDVVLTIRMDKAMEMLKHNELSIDHIGKAVGYRVPSHFTRAFVRRFGCPPRNFRVTTKSS